MSVNDNEWLPLRQAVVEIAQAYSQFMLCPANECLPIAVERLMSRLEREICDARADGWEFSLEKGEETVEHFYGEKGDDNGPISGLFWRNVRVYADGLGYVFDWVSGEFSYKFEGPDDYWGAGLAINVEVTRDGLPLVGGAYGFEAAAVKQRMNSLPMETRGRRRIWDWEGAICAVVAQANSLDGLPVGRGAHAEICKLLRQWFLDNQHSEPASSEIGLRATRIMEAINRK